MDWFPLFNSLRIALLATVIVFFAGLFAANRVTRLPPSPLRGALDAVLTLTLILPPPVIGWLVLRWFAPAWNLFHIRLVMHWLSAVLVSVLVSFPLMYRVARIAFERFDSGLTDIARTLGRSEVWIFWNVQVPVCRHGVVAGTALAFGRAFGEYAATSMVAGYIPARTATVSTALYQSWSGGDNGQAALWASVSILLSGLCLLAVGVVENRQRGDGTL